MLSRSADDLAVLRFGQAPDEQIYFAWILREISRNLLADKSIGIRRKREAALDRVVIGDGDEIHPGLFGAGVKLVRIGVAIGEIEPAKDPILGSIAEFRMQMKVAAAHAVRAGFGAPANR